MKQRTSFASMRLRIIQHGPNDERWFGLFAGMIAAIGVVVLAVLVSVGAVERGWFVLGFSTLTLTWLLGPLLIPGLATPMNPQWFRTLPRTPQRIARELAPSEALSVGVAVTVVALVSVVIVAAPAGGLVMSIAVLAAVAQMWLLLWLGRCASVLLTALLSTQAGVYIAAAQLSVILSLSFAGWVPVAASALPNIGTGDTTYAGFGAIAALLPDLETALLALPTAWALNAVDAATASSPLIALAWVLALCVAALALRTTWIALTARAIQRPPARAQSNLAARPTLLARTSGGPLRAVVSREVKTWLRDPHRKLELVLAWTAPIVMIALVAPTSWFWALPFIGVPAAATESVKAGETDSVRRSV